MSSPPRFTRRTLRLAVLVLCVPIAGCRTVVGPERTLEAYARALQENRLDEAYALTSADTRAGVGREAFYARYEDPVKRRARAEALLAAVASLRACTPEVEAVREDGQWLVRELPTEEGARQVLREFLDASERGDFATAFRLLSASWRSRYTPERLARDFRLEPLARERIERARAVLVDPFLLEGDAARLPMGEGRAVRLVREGGIYRVAAIE